MCWHSAHDTLTNISISSLNKLYSSLSSAKPSASSYTFDPLALIAATATTSVSSVSTTGSSAAPSTTSAYISTPSASSQSSSLSGAAIAGIAIGVLAAFALLAGGFYMFARHKRQKNAEAREVVGEADAKERQELGAEERSELPASKPAASGLYENYSDGVATTVTEPQELPACLEGRD
ncbi:hypothetical protein FKW77_001032 [Venturia effusa]|uniref:Mid2 domain-containing protein n=1 Tax=Venturia effusa TaxID=50376 RepID=A0A517LQK3_9PEZI|nr:hypothetical protein FKW77_001032 [Venturia effusa]